MESDTPERADVLVVGAGAAGLWAAARAAELGARVVLLEKTPRAGTKVLASGGTRCNLTTTLPAEEAARLFGRDGERFLRRALRALGPGDVRRRFADLGVPTVEEGLEKVFPASGRARDVRDALQRWAVEAGARLVRSTPVVGVERVGGDGGGDDGWRVWCAEGVRYDARRLVLAPGGMSYPRTGTTGDGYAWLRALELEVVEPVPALVPLASAARWVHGLAGVALQDASVRLVDAKGKTLGRRARPVLFTHKGVSGPGAMDLSELVARRLHEPPTDESARRERGGLSLVVDALPAVEREELRALLVEAAGRPGSPALHNVLARAWPHALPRGLVHAIAHQAGLDDGRVPVRTLSRSGRHALVEATKGLAVPVEGTLGFDAAEVTAGGLALREVDPGSMAVRSRKGLFVVGEVLDVQGPIGGLNFQAAFSTAELAARAAARAHVPADGP